MERKGLSFEELEAQDTGLLPDRVEMHRRRRGVRVTQTTLVGVENNNTNIAFAEAEATGLEIEFDWRD